MMRTAMYHRLLEGIPMQGAKQRPILALPMRKKRLAAERVGARPRKADQRRANLAVAAKRRVHGQPRAIPHVRRFLMDAYRAHYLLGYPGKTAHCNQLLGPFVDL